MQTKFDITQLSPIQRIILTMSATLTRVLEVLVLEKICVLKLSEQQIILNENMPVLDIYEGAEIIERTILLQGETTKKNWLYAHSILISERLGEEFRNHLLNSKIPIGKLWIQHKVETFKEGVEIFSEPANDLSEYFGIKPQETLLGRTYKVFSNSQPIMLITEKFPKIYYC